MTAIPAPMPAGDEVPGETGKGLLKAPINSSPAIEGADVANERAARTSVSVHVKSFW